jgi:hypothetical protein
MRSLGPQHLAAIFQPIIQRLKIRNARGDLRQTSCCKHAIGVMARIADVLLNLVFLPPGSWIAKLRLDDQPQNAVENTQGMSMSIRQHPLTDGAFR